MVVSKSKVLLGLVREIHELAVKHRDARAQRSWGFYGFDAHVGLLRILLVIA